MRRAAILLQPGSPMVERGMATSRLYLASVAALLLVGAVALPSTASAQSGDEDDAPVKEYSLANISAVYGLRCDSLLRGKVKSKEAMIYRSEAERVRGPARLASEQRYTQAESAASAAESAPPAPPCSTTRRTHSAALVPSREKSPFEGSV